MSEIMVHSPSAHTQPVAETPVVVIEPGRNVYGHDGRRAEYVGAQGSRHLVRPIARFTDWQGEEYEEPTDALELWDRAYPKPPVPCVSEEIAVLQAEVTAQRAELRKVADETREAQKGTLAMLKRLARYEPLKNLEPLLNGEITHVVEGSGYSILEIKDFETAKTYQEDYSRKDALRMLSLKPTADGAITWHLNRWSDGSGTDSPVILCASEEEAKEAAAAVAVSALSRHSFESHPHLWATAAANAERLGLEIDADVIAKATTYRLSEAQRIADDAAKRLAEAEMAIAALKTAPANSVGTPEGVNP